MHPGILVGREGKPRSGLEEVLPLLLRIRRDMRIELIYDAVILAMGKGKRPAFGNDKVHRPLAYIRISPSCGPSGHEDDHLAGTLGFP